MVGFVSRITKINEELARLLNQAHKEGLNIFYYNPRYKAILEIQKGLGLNDHMSISELVQAIRFIEEIKILDQNKKVTLFKNILSNDLGNLTLSSYGIAESSQSKEQKQQKKQSPVELPKSSILVNILAEVHNVLLSHYELSKAHAQGNIPVSMLEYDSDLLKQTQIAQDIENTTKAEKTSDGTTSVMDIRRGGTTFYGVQIAPGENDCYIRPTIERFAGDAIETPGSKANKIFHFGGQILPGIILDELENTMEIIDNDRHLTEGLKPSLTRGNVNWLKDPDTGAIYAEVELKIISCAFFDPINTSKPPEYFAIRSDGTTLGSIDEDTVLQIGQAIKKDDTDVVPICTFNAKLDLLKDEKTGDYYLKMDKFTVKINTADMISSKDTAYNLLHSRPLAFS